MPEKNYEIDCNGDVYYKGNWIRRHEILGLLQWLDSSPRLYGGHRASPNEGLRIGCVTILGEELAQFCEEYKAEGWKKPPEPTYQLGDKFRHQIIGSKFMLICEKDNTVPLYKVGLVNLDTGVILNSAVGLDNPQDIKLSDLGLANPDFFHPLKE